MNLSARTINTIDKVSCLSSLILDFEYQLFSTDHIRLPSSSHGKPAGRRGRARAAGPFFYPLN